MTDRDLLELAANSYFGADGYEWNACAGSAGRIQYIPADGNGYMDWLPLSNNVDAQRLAAKCRITIGAGAGTGSRRIAYYAGGQLQVIDVDTERGEFHLPVDLDAATRLAVVQAAAEMSRQGA